MSRRRPAILRNRQHELALGVGMFLASAWLIYDSYEGRGVKRPFAAHFLP